MTAFNFAKGLEGKLYKLESKNKENAEELEVAFLIMKTSPIKYDLTLVNEKCKKLNSMRFSKQLIQEYNIINKVFKI